MNTIANIIAAPAGTVTLAEGSDVVTSALNLFSQFAIIGGGLWAVWGVITVVGGGLIIAAAALFKTIAL